MLRQEETRSQREDELKALIDAQMVEISHLREEAMGRKALQYRVNRLNERLALASGKDAVIRELEGELARRGEEIRRLQADVAMKTAANEHLRDKQKKAANHIAQLSRSLDASIADYRRECFRFLAASEIAESCQADRDHWFEEYNAQAAKNLKLKAGFRKSSQRVSKLMEDRHDEAWMHAACGSIAEGAPGWEGPVWKESAAIGAVRALRISEEGKAKALDAAYRELEAKDTEIAALRQQLATKAQADFVDTARICHLRPYAAIRAEVPPSEVLP